MQKRGPQNREKIMLSAKGLLTLVRKTFEKIKHQKTDPRGRKKEISLADSLMSALAMFSLKSSSLLAFNRGFENPVIRNNLKELYGIEQPPSDTHMRTELDEVDPSTLRNAFLSIFQACQKGNLLEQYSFLGGSYLAAIDGTGVFESHDISCDDCCEKKSRDGKITYYHQMLGAAIVHPDYRQVIPLCPELISKQDGTSKNDCEQRALQRIIAAIKKEHPRLKLTLVLDALSANAPTINTINSHGYHYIINVKPGGNKTLFEWTNGIELSEESVTIGQNKYVFRFINKIPVNETKDAPLVNFIECKATEVNGKKISEKTFTWVTSHRITKDNVYLIMRGGRSRWKIENEAFNTLKNQGYQLEHNFGHGEKHLFAVFTLLMMLAFLIDQIQEAACGLFQAALAKTVSRRALWEALKNYFYTYYVNSWSDLFTAISQSFAATLTINTS